MLNLVGSGLTVLALLYLVAMNVKGAGIGFRRRLTIRRTVHGRRCRTTQVMKTGSLRAAHALTILETCTVSLRNAVKRRLFRCPRCCNTRKLLFTPRSRRALHLGTSDLCTCLNTEPRITRGAMSFLTHVYHSRVNERATLGCCVDTLLLSGGLSGFMSTISVCYFRRSALPHCCHRTLILCGQARPKCKERIGSALVIQHLSRFLGHRGRFSSPIRRGGRVQQRCNSAC